MEYRLEDSNREKILHLGCPYCFKTKKIKDKDIIKILLNREEKNENQNKGFDEEILFDEVVYQTPSFF